MGCDDTKSSIQVAQLLLRESADRTSLYEIAMQHADDGYSLFQT